MQLSVIVPAIRKDNWRKLYDSIGKSFSGTWELILIGPYAPDFEESNLSWIEDWGCPSRCCQIGLVHSAADWISFGWDDGWFHEGAMDEAWKLLELENYQRAVIGKYVEGNVDQLLLQTGGAPSPMTQEHYYYVMTHLAAASHHIPKDFKIFMTGIVSKQMLLEVGGFDCSLETMGMSLLDMSIRMQLRGCKMVVQPSVLITCGWDIGDSGDHAPVNRAFNEMICQNIKRSGVGSVKE